MFGVVQSCASGKEAWREHMCGLCLTLRDGHGQMARATTNTDAIMLSLLTEAQTARAPRRTAGPCPLRGMKTAPVVTSDSPGAELAATASLLLGAAKASDWATDGDGRFRARLSKRPRIAHLSDAVADLEIDRRRGAFNPIDATGTPLTEIDDLLGHARDQVRSATALLTLADPEPVSTILVHGTNRAVASAQEPVRRPSLSDGVVVILSGYCTGYACCFEHTAPCSGKRKPPVCSGYDCDCGDCACCCDG